jgi:hypothetical protein
MTIDKNTERKQKAIRRRWVAALRSGDYKQGKGFLRTKGKGKQADKFCCLGVLCELAVKAKVINPPDIDSNTFNYGAYIYGGSIDILPNSVTEWAGLQDSAALFHGEEESLATINDAGKRFSTIANIIESEPEGLFVN